MLRYVVGFTTFVFAHRIVCLCVSDLVQNNIKKRADMVKVMCPDNVSCFTIGVYA